MRKMLGRRLPWAILAVLLGIQAALALATQPASLAGDEHYYVERARTIRENGYPVASSNALAAEHRRAWEAPDFRPPGYPTFVAIISGGNWRVTSLRQRATVIQLGLLSLAVLCTFAAFAATVTDPPAKLAAAILLGGMPWQFEHVTSLLADSLTASLAALGSVQLFKATQSPRSRPAAAFAGMLLLAFPLLLRPEMVVIPPIVGIVVILLAGRAAAGRAAAAMALAFALMVSVQYTYRVHFTQSWVTSLYPLKTLSYYKSLGDWAGRLTLPEKVVMEFVWTLSSGGVPAPLPPEAYRSETERRAVEAMVREVSHSGTYTRQMDALFARLNREHAEQSFVSYHVTPRLWHTFRLWVNTETNPQLLNVLSGMPRWLSKTTVGALLAAKTLVLSLAVVGFIRAAARLRRHRTATPLVALTLLSGTFVLTRTVLIGVVINSIEHRYMLPAWIFLLVCSSTACVMPSSAWDPAARTTASNER